MGLRNILINGDEQLRKTSRPVTDFGQKTWDLMDDLRETMENASGAGLAAPQVGILRRAVVIVRDEEVVELINPEVLEHNEETEEMFEGCLSVPNMRGLVSRPTYVKVKAQDRSGNWFELECHGFSARAALHEIDHLDGKLYIDYVDRLYTEEEVEEILFGDDED